MRQCVSDPLCHVIVVWHCNTECNSVKTVRNKKQQFDSTKKKQKNACNSLMRSCILVCDNAFTIHCLPFCTCLTLQYWMQFSQNRAKQKTAIWLKKKKSKQRVQFSYAFLYSCTLVCDNAFTIHCLPFCSCLTLQYWTHEGVFVGMFMTDQSVRHKEWRPRQWIAFECLNMFSLGAWSAVSMGRTHECARVQICLTESHSANLHQIWHVVRNPQSRIQYNMLVSCYLFGFAFCFYFLLFIFIFFSSNTSYQAKQRF